MNILSLVQTALELSLICSLTVLRFGGKENG